MQEGGNGLMWLVYLWMIVIGFFLPSIRNIKCDPDLQ